MGYTYEFDLEQSTIFLRREGVIKKDELKNSLKEICSHEEFSQMKKIFANISNCNLKHLTRPDVIEYSEYYNMNCLHLKSGVIVTSDLSFGTTRMFETYSNHSNMYISRSIDDVKQWLDIETIPDAYL